MGTRNQSKQTRTARLVIRKETVRNLRTLSDDELQAANGGWVKPPPPRPSVSTIC